MIDSHCHLTLSEQTASELVGAAAAAGVRRLLTVGLGEDSNPEAVRLAESHDEVWAAVGRHPNSAAGFDDAAAAAISELASHPRVAAIGETGLDYYRDGAPRDDQRRAFEAQIDIARRTAKPLVVHMRDAADDTFSILRERAEGIVVVLHCFSAGPAEAAEAGERGWLCSFAGNLTYPRSDPIRDAARVVPADLLLVETDAPYLSPQSLRGRPNQPANVVETAQRLADERGITYPELEALVEQNASRVFGW